MNGLIGAALSYPARWVALASEWFNDRANAPRPQIGDWLILSAAGLLLAWWVL